LNPSAATPPRRLAKVAEVSDLSLRLLSTQSRHEASACFEDIDEGMDDASYFTLDILVDELRQETPAFAPIPTRMCTANPQGNAIRAIAVA
jgi:hypothetical protein